MATETATADKDDLVLTAPEPLKTRPVEKMAELVPVDEAKKTELVGRVESFIEDLIAQDINSSEFGKRVDAITAMGQKEIRGGEGRPTASSTARCRRWTRMPALARTLPNYVAPSKISI